MEVYKYTGKDDIRYMPTKRFKSIIEQYPLEIIKTMQKNHSNHDRQVQSVQVMISWVQKAYIFFGLKTS